jgi:hypothetical protein
MNTERDPEPLDEAFDALRRMPVPDRPADADADLLARLAAGPSPAAGPAPPTDRRMVMRIATWSLAASALAAVGGVLLLTGSPSVALADVLKATEKHKLVKFTSTQSVETKDGSAVEPLVQTVYADLKAPRSRTVQWTPGHLSGALDFEFVSVRDARKEKNVAIHIITETITEKGKTDPKLIEMLKDFEKIGVPRKEVAIDWAHGNLAPAQRELNKPLLENFLELEKHKDAVATKGKLGDKAVLKYRIEEEHKTTVLWVDKETKLPVRLEHETTKPEDLHPDYTSTKYVLSDFEWDPELKGFKDLDELFSTTPPKGYKVEDRRKKKEEKPDQPPATVVPAKP